jgi:hypothetical protein
MILSQREKSMIQIDQYKRLLEFYEFQGVSSTIR